MVIIVGYALAFLLTLLIVPFGAVEGSIENLWIKEGGRVYEEVQYMKDYMIQGIGREFILIDHTTAFDEEVLPGEDMLVANKLIAIGDFLQSKMDISVDVKDIEGNLHAIKTQDVLDGGSTGAYNRLSVLDCFVEGEFDYIGEPVAPLDDDFNSLVDETLFDIPFTVTPYNWCMFAKIYPVMDLLGNPDREQAVASVPEGWAPVNEGVCKQVSLFFCLDEEGTRLFRLYLFSSLSLAFVSLILSLALFCIPPEHPLLSFSRTPWLPPSRSTNSTRTYRKFTTTTASSCLIWSVPRPTGSLTIRHRLEPLLFLMMIVLVMTILPEVMMMVAVVEVAGRQ